MMEMEKAVNRVWHILSGPPLLSCCLSAEHVSPADCMDDLREGGGSDIQTAASVYVQAHVS